VVTRRLPVPEISRVGFRDKKGCGRQFSMMSFSDSEFYCECNSGTLVTRRLPVPEIEKSPKRGVVDNFR
jgi:hypothetical protein